MKRALLLFSVAAGLLVGCGDATSSGATGAPAGSGTAAAVALADSDLPVAADFAEEAEKAITPASYKGDLDALEKEIDADK